MTRTSWPWQPPPGFPVSVDPVFGCWIFTGTLNNKGYGYGYRALWERTMGLELPAAVALDHVCRVKSCCNPRHLDPVTRSENERRKSARYRRAHLTRCPLGHRLVPESTLRTPQDGVVCRLCLEQP